MTLPSTITTEDLIALDYKYHYNDQELYDDWYKLKNATTFLKGSQFKPGMKLCQHFCDNFWNIENDKGLSFAKAWQDPKIMSDVITWGTKSMSSLWMSWIRRAVFMRAGIANSSFYRPHFSKQIIRMHDKSNGILFDPCHGWGGRMLGTVAANWSYIGCDPNTVTFNNVSDIASFLNIQDKVTLLNIPAEEYTFIPNSVDIVLTSPPYFNLEMYNDNPDQSYNKFNTYEVWENKWLRPLISSSISMIKDNGISAWNVMNFKKNDLVNAVITEHEKHGYLLVDTIGFNSPLNNIRKLKNKDVTYVFKKRLFNDFNDLQLSH
jgi:hypothetical protein